MAVKQLEEPGPVSLKPGKLIGKRWKIVTKLGEGGCGAVYECEDVKTRTRAALKAESNFVAGGSVLKLEAQILRRLKGRKYVANLFHAGRKDRYAYVVMTLLGDSIDKVFRRCDKQFTVSTQVRIGVHVLFGLKQLHEVGYVHRDIKPANLALGRNGREAKIVHLLDFGLAREFIIISEGKVEMRRERTNTLFRGTTRYCSMNAHKNEQGRADDLWSMLYVLAEMRGRLPWHSQIEKREILRMKLATSDARLLAKCPVQMMQIAAHLRELCYYTRPDYLKIYRVLVEIMNAYGYRFLDPFDWELLPTDPLNLKPKKISPRIVTIDDNSAEKTLDVENERRKTGRMSAKTNLALDPTMEDTDEDAALYREDDFARNELGF